MDRPNTMDALATAAGAVLAAEARVPATAGLAVEAYQATVLLSAALSCDGERFDVRVILDPASPIGGDAVCEFRDSGALITIARVPAALLSAGETARAVGLVVIAAEAFVAAKAARDGFEWQSMETASHYLTRMALSQTKAAIDRARLRLCH